MKSSVAKVVQVIDDEPIERIALDDAKGDPVAAVELLTKRILADPDIVRDDFHKWAHSWSHAKVYGLLAQQRRTILRVVNSDNFASALSSAMNNEMVRLMDMPIFGGKRMADATPAEVRESAKRYELLADDTARKARWQNMVAAEAEKVGADVIGAALTEDALVRLWGAADA